MGLTLRPGLSVRFEAEEGSYLYDCHGGRFAPVEHGACAASGFVPFYVSQLFGMPVSAWNRTQAEVTERFEGDPAATREWIAEHLVPGNSIMAAEAALLVYPSMERFVERCRDDHAPFRLTERWLMQDNVPLARLRVRDRARGDRDAVVGLDDASRRREARALMLALGAGALDERSELARALRPALTDAPAPAAPAPAGVYLCGHSTVLLRGRRRGLLIDPVAFGPCAASTGALPPTVLASQCDAVALTHLHFDHYDLPTLLALSDRPVLVPAVPRASVVAEDAAARLRSFGVPDVRALAWGQRLELDSDLSVEVLPFRGEQILTSETHPEARNWGNAYVVEVAGARVLIVADAGFERDRSIIDEAAELRARSGPVDVLITQAAGMRAAFCGGDADFQVAGLTCAHRAPETFELLAPERRITLAPDDVPLLCEASGARHVVLHGQFAFDVGSPAVSERKHAEVAAALAGSRAVALHRVGVGAGLSLPDLAPQVLYRP